MTESSKIIAWNWKAGGATPSKTYYVKVVDDSGTNIDLLMMLLILIIQF